jgi:hypothetical protein
MPLAAVGAAGIGLVWGWLLVQMISSLRPMPGSVVGMGAAAGGLLLTIFVAVAGEATAIAAAAMLLAALSHRALLIDLRRAAREQGHVVTRQEG